MGYYATLDFSNAMIPLSLEKEAMEAVYRLDEAADHLKQGGSYQGGKQVSRHFSWMPVDLREFSTLSSLLQALGFECVIVDGNLYIERFDNKVGQEDLFFFALAPFIQQSPMNPNRASMEWTGEDGSKWRWTFHDGQMTVWEANISWTGPTIAAYEWEDHVRGAVKA
jgi:hypothetical protein